MTPNALYHLSFVVVLVRYVSSGGNTIDQEAECAGWQGEGGEGHYQDLHFPGLNK